MCIFIIFSLELTNEATKSSVIHTRRSDSVANVFAQLFGENAARALLPLHHITSGVVAASLDGSDGLQLHGFISGVGHHNRALQFFYVNGRHVFKTPL